MNAILANAIPLRDWTYTAPLSQSLLALPRQLLKLTGKVDGVWQNHVNYIENTSNKRIPGLSYDSLSWQHRKNDCIRMVSRLLRLLNQEEMDECRSYMVQLRSVLRREWDREGALGPRDVIDRGWAWIRPGEY